jgi:hypothetical protein
MATKNTKTHKKEEKRRPVMEMAGKMPFLIGLFLCPLVFFVATLLSGGRR